MFSSVWVLCKCFHPRALAPDHAAIHGTDAQLMYRRAGFVGIAKIALTYKGSANCKYLILYFGVHSINIYVSLDSFGLVGLLNNIQMVVGIICCCVPAFKPLIPAQGFWSQLSLRLLNIRTRSRTSPNASSRGSQPRLDASEAPDDTGKRKHAWQHIYEDNSSAQGIAWNENTHHFEACAMSDLETNGRLASGPGIQIERQIDIRHAV